MNKLLAATFLVAAAAVAAAQTVWRFEVTDGGSATCTGTSGSCATTCLVRTTIRKVRSTTLRARQLPVRVPAPCAMDRPGRFPGLMNLTWLVARAGMSCAADAGTWTRRTAAPRDATRSASELFRSSSLASASAVCYRANLEIAGIDPFDGCDFGRETA